MIYRQTTSKESTASNEFVSLLTNYQPDLWAFILSLMPGDPDAADVLQKTNITLWNKKDSFELGTNFRAWSFKVARFKVLGHRKAIARSRELLLDEELLDVVAKESSEFIQNSDQRLPSLEKCLKELRPNDLQLIYCRYNGSGGLEKYSQASGRSVASLSSTLYRLRAALRKCVKTQMLKERGLL